MADRFRIEVPQELCGSWAEGFDWREAEARFNAWDHFRRVADGEQLHYVHAPSPHPGALPLLLTHGWPGSVVEFLGVLGPLTVPPAYGGDATDAFTVVGPLVPATAVRASGTARRAATEAASLRRTSACSTLPRGRPAPQHGEHPAPARLRRRLPDGRRAARPHRDARVPPPLLRDLQRRRAGDAYRARRGADRRRPLPREIYRPPRRWVEEAFDLRRWTVMQRGGHFAALEQPELLVDDVRAFFRDLR